MEGSSIVKYGREDFSILDGWRGLAQHPSSAGVAQTKVVVGEDYGGVSARLAAAVLASPTIRRADSKALLVLAVKVANHLFGQVCRKAADVTAIDEVHIDAVQLPKPESLAW